MAKRLEEETVSKMIEIYCREVHGSSKGKLCPECSDLLAYARKRIEKCPYGEEKPVCSKCKIHCYKPEMREKIRAVMRYSGPKMLIRSPLLTIHYMYRKSFKSNADNINKKGKPKGG